VALVASRARPARAAAEGEKEFFETRIRPVLQTNCLLCHGGARIRGGLEVTSRAALLKGGEHGRAVVPGDPEKSWLIRAVRYDGKIRMPPKGKLDERQIADLVDWVKRGAPWP
jgi:mono/diheme cytochrome c family protein